jgi:hypothetical protein
MKSFKFVFLTLLAAFALSLTGCIKPVEPKLLITASPNETMFVVPLIGENQKGQDKFNSEEYFNQKKVAVREFQVPHRWLQTGRFEYDGKWIPAVSVIKVDRSPVTVAFDVTKETEAPVWVESADSVGFSTGFSVSAMIEEQDTARFLYRYQAAGLKTVIAKEVRARIQAVAADFAARYPLDKLRSMKTEMMAAIRADLIPFFKERGINITTVGQFGGMTYENKDIQVAIDKVFIAQQEKETAKAALDAVADINKKTAALAEQEKTNAITLATGKAEAVRLEAEAIAKGNLLKAQADASGIEAVSKATQVASSNPLFLEVRKLDVQTKMYEKWTGQVPSTVIADGGVHPNIFLPTTSDTPKSVVRASSVSH